MLEDLIQETQEHCHELKAKYDEPDTSRDIKDFIKWNIRGLDVLKEIQDAYIFKNTIKLDVVNEGRPMGDGYCHFQIKTKTARGRYNYIEVEIGFSIDGKLYGDVNSSCWRNYSDGGGVYPWEDVKSIILKSRNIEHLYRLRKKHLEGHEVKGLL